MSTSDIEHQRQWIGKTRSDQDILSVRHARLMAATLGLGTDNLREGDPLPPLWHWLYFLEGAPASELGSDGHPARGGFLPPVPQSNRMWAGGQLSFHAPLRLGQAVERVSRISNVEHKSGKSGPLIFVTVEHKVSADGRVAITELQDIVYKQPGPPARAGTPQAQPAPERSRSVTPDSTCLFRYSALTFNGHRIHYDADYCRQVEGYDNLVIHGPLIATLLAGFAAEGLGTAGLSRFSYRAVQPSLLGVTLTLNTLRTPQGMSVWAGLPGGGVAMQAQAA
ncbi:MAG: MaoC family dehydratase N-terminal domain-containing protein [Burkholderiaceae bacterium]|nr:MaoC family dehydratase N-terminal domain-containing protein [Burkholderiaceae bacterium]